MVIGGRLGGGSYCEAWEVGDALVLHVPRVVEREPATHGYGPLTGDHVSPTGPFALLNIELEVTSRQLFEAAIDRLRGVEVAVLARLVDRLELAGTPVALHERAPGRSIATLDVAELRAQLPAIARALLELHGRFGFHGDLKPAHVFIEASPDADASRVTFIDPLPITGVMLFGSYGYSLPVMPRDPTDPRDEGWLMRDVISLAAIAAECWGVDLALGPLGNTLMNVDNGRFGHGFDATVTLGRLHAMTRTISAPLRLWIDQVCDTTLGLYRPISRPLRPGTASALLATLR